MTTKEAEKGYLDEHLSIWRDKNFAVYNPHNKLVKELSIIYGFNNGGSDNIYYGQLISEDGLNMGSHICSGEDYMLHDLGILEESRPDRHNYFREQYPDGYRMMFVRYTEVAHNKGLLKALQKASTIEEGVQDYHNEIYLNPYKEIDLEKYNDWEKGQELAKSKDA